MLENTKEPQLNCGNCSQHPVTEPPVEVELSS